MHVDLVAMGTRVRSARERTGHGQRELADATGIPRAHLSRIEDGRPSRATLEQLNLLAHALDVSLQHLLCGSTSAGPSSGETTVADSARTLTHASQSPEYVPLRSLPAPSGKSPCGVFPR